MIEPFLLPAAMDILFINQSMVEFPGRKVTVVYPIMPGGTWQFHQIMSLIRPFLLLVIAVFINP